MLGAVGCGGGVALPHLPIARCNGHLIGMEDPSVLLRSEKTLNASDRACVLTDVYVSLFTGLLLAVSAAGMMPARCAANTPAASR